MIDSLLNVKKPSGRHIGPSAERDFDAILHVLQEQKIFEIKGRKHRAFPNLRPICNYQKKP